VENVPPPDSFAPTELLVISEGLFRMGGKAEEDDPDEKPFHELEMYEFRIDKYEVTNAQYRACIAAGVCPPPTKTGSYTRAAYFADPGYADYPVINVTWYGADAYCKWVGRRLPHEGEWERAAKGVENWRYTWSNSIGMHFEWNAIFHGSPISFCEASCPLQTYWTDVNDGFPDTAPVGRFAEYDNSSGFGVIDMSGNVAEWTNTWYDPNAYSNGNDLYGPAEPTGAKVVRGGSWADEPRRNSDREPQAPDFSSERIGFRCAQ
jgi:formylglycine-generating enzyme required for sulfatase activity